MNRMLALAGLILLSPLFFIVIATILLVDGVNPIFTQQRLGLHEQCFKIFKFRTMNDEGHTRLGGLLRKTHLDELPQLVNILAGKMTFIGPRPLLCSYKGQFSPSESRRHTVLPGITGLAQVLGGKSISWEQQFLLDRVYVTYKSLALNFWIIWQTLKAIGQSNANSAIEIRKWER